MNRILRKIAVGTWVLLVVIGPILAGEPGGTGAIHSESMALSEAAAKAENSWPNDLAGYCKLYEDVLGTIPLRSSVETSFPPEVAASLLKPLLLKADSVESLDSPTLIDTQSRAMSLLISNIDVVHTPLATRLDVIETCVAFLTGVQNRLIPHFKEFPVYLNLTPQLLPPDEVVISGMDPNDIKNPVARAAYLKAGYENQLHNAINSEQSELFSILQEGCWELPELLQDSNVSDPKQKARITILTKQLEQLQKAIDARKHTKENSASQ